MDQLTKLDETFFLFPSTVIVVLFILLAFGLYVRWKNRMAKLQAEDKTPVEFKAPRLNTHLEDAEIALTRAKEALGPMELNLGFAKAHLDNYWIEIQSGPVPAAERVTLVKKGQRVNAMRKKMAEATLTERALWISGNGEP